MHNKNAGEKLNRFGAREEPSHEEVNSHLKIAGLEAREGERIIAKPVRIEEIFPDPLQPRRAIPSSVRRTHDYVNNPKDVMKVLVSWQAKAQNEGGVKIDVNKVIGGDAEIELADDAPTVLVNFVKLMKLAGSIHETGLLQPIKISEREEGGYVVVLGERRLLAHHMLKMVYGAKYERIPAIVDNYDIWAQAAENGVRQELNAIQTARQVCRLIMDFYWKPEEFEDFSAMVFAGESDRRYWNQVANGNAYPLNANQYEKIFSHTDLNSKHQISQYRRIVRDLNDEEWAQAEDEGWSEGRIRVYIANKTAPTRLTAVNPDEDEETLTTVKVDEDNPHPVDLRSHAPSPLRNEGEQSAGVRRIPSVRDDQWDDDEDYRSTGAHTPPARDFHELSGVRKVAPQQSPQVERERATYIGSDAPPVLDDATFLVTDIEIEALVGLAADIAKNRGEMNAWEIISWLVGLSTDHFPHYGGDVDTLNDEVLVAVDTVKTVIEDVLDRLENWQVERITSEFEDAHGLR